MLLSHDHPVLSNLLLGMGLFGAMLGLLLLGRRLGKRTLAGHTEDQPGLGAIEGAIFALFGLLVALTFSGASDRFHERKGLIVREAQDVSTAYSRLDLLPEAVRKDLQARMRAYVKARLAAYETPESLEALEADLGKAADSGAEIWRIAAETCREPGLSTASLLVLPAISQALDTAAARTAILRKHPPRVIFLFLIFLALLCAFLAGFSMARGAVLSRLHVVIFPLAAALTICVTLDLEHPRFGMISVKNADRELQRALAGMK